MKSFKLLLSIILLCALSFAGRAELLDQGLNSIMEIIDKAITELNQQAPEDGGELDPAVLENATNTIVNLSRTLGTLSYSRLQCGEAGVLAEFTQRVQQMPDESRDPMRDAFQEGFDKSKDDTPLLSQDECERLTRSRNRGESESETEANVAADPSKTKAVEEPVEEVVEELPPEDPKFRHLRVAELSGQLAYKRKFCEDEEVFNRDYNEYLGSIPEEYREEVKAAYWKGYQRGKRLNKGLTKDKCHSS
jgi:predicted secreted protein